MKKIVFAILLLLGPTPHMFSQFVNGEILSDSNNVTIARLWGTSEERGFAYGFLLGDKMVEILEGFGIPYWGADWPKVKQMVAEGISIQIDSIYWKEAQAIIEGVTAAGFNSAGYTSLDVMASNCWHDLFAWDFTKANKGELHCSALMNWNEATIGTDLDGCSVISRHADDDYPIPAVVDNAVIIIHIPSEPDLQPWLLIGYAGDMAPYSGISSSGLSIFSTSLDDQTWNYSTQAGYEPFKFAFRKALESKDYNQDGVNDMLDIKDALSSNSLGYSWGWNFAALAPSTAVYDSMIAMVAEVAPESPYITFRSNTYNDALPGDNLYAANSQIKRNNHRHYCSRYYGIVNNIGNGTGISAQDNWDLMKYYSNLGNNNLQFMQYIPEWGQLKLSVYQNNLGAYIHNPVTYDVNEFFHLDTPIAYFAADTCIVIEGDSVHFTDLSGNNPTYWIWKFDGGDPGTSNAQNPIIVYHTPGIYDVTLFVSNIYGSDTLTLEDYITVDPETGIDNKNDTRLMIFPNPVKDKLNIHHFELINSIDILDISGQVVKSYECNENQMVLNINNLADGIFFVRLLSKNEEIVKKIVKMR